MPAGAFHHAGSRDNQTPPLRRAAGLEEHLTLFHRAAPAIWTRPAAQWEKGVPAELRDSARRLDNRWRVQPTRARPPGSGRNVDRKISCFDDPSTALRGARQRVAEIKTCSSKQTVAPAHQCGAASRLITRRSRLIQALVRPIPQHPAFLPICPGHIRTLS